VDLVADNVRDVYEATGMLAYDHTVLEFRKAEKGEFFQEDGRPASLTIEANPGAGRLQFSFGRRAKPVSGTGVLASLVFRAKQPGVSKVEIMSARILGAEDEQVAFSKGPGLIRVR